MSLQRNYYEILGIPREATTDQIKKKYRELARKFHPDVVQDKILGQRVFSQINQAYRVLADPERRAQYNSTLIAKAAVTAGPSPTVAVMPQEQSAAQKRSPQAQTQARPSQLQTPPTAQARPVAPQGQPGAAQKAQAIAARLRDADNAIMAGKPIEASAFCTKILEIDPGNIQALEILGDALVQMGRREDAAVQYRNALRTAPSSLIQAKLSRLDQAAPSTRTNPPNRSIAPDSDGEKPGVGLFGRFMGRK